MTNYNDGNPSIDLLHKHFRYDSETGKMYTKTNRRNVHIGDEVGSRDRQGYLITSLYKKLMRVHRMAWAMTYGEWPEGVIDHINGVTDDNRIANLRDVTPGQNRQNVTPSAANTSGFLGVSFHKLSGRWTANIKVNKKAHYLGLFDCPREAYDAYLAAKKVLHPFNEVLK